MVSDGVLARASHVQLYYCFSRVPPVDATQEPIVRNRVSGIAVRVFCRETLPQRFMLICHGHFAWTIPAGGPCDAQRLPVWDTFIAGTDTVRVIAGSKCPRVTDLIHHFDERPEDWAAVAGLSGAARCEWTTVQDTRSQGGVYCRLESLAVNDPGDEDVFAAALDAFLTGFPPAGTVPQKSPLDPLAAWETDVYRRPGDLDGLVPLVPLDAGTREALRPVLDARAFVERWDHRGIVVNSGTGVEAGECRRLSERVEFLERVLEFTRPFVTDHRHRFFSFVLASLSGLGVDDIDHAGIHALYFGLGGRERAMAIEAYRACFSSIEEPVNTIVRGAFEHLGLVHAPNVLVTTSHVRHLMELADVSEGSAAASLIFREWDAHFDRAVHARDTVAAVALKRLLVRAFPPENAMAWAVFCVLRDMIDCRAVAWHTL